MTKTSFSPVHIPIRTIFVFTICVLSFSTSVQPARANGAPPPEPDMGGVAPYQPIETNVQMMSETVLIDVRPHPTRWIPNDEYLMNWNQVNVKASFTLRNQGAAVEQMQVIFPLSRLDYPWLTSSYDIISSSFVAKVDGRPVSTTEITTPPELHALPEGWNADAPPDGVFWPDVRWAAFAVTFPVGTDVIVQVEYDMRAQSEIGLHHIDYIIETGAGWYGRILSGDIILRLPYPATRESVPQAAPGCIFSGNEVQCHLENYEPQRKDNLAFGFLDTNEWIPTAELRARVEQYPEDADAWYQLAKHYNRLGLWWGDVITNPHMLDLSIAAFEQAVTLRPDWGDAHCQLASTLWYSHPKLKRGFGGGVIQKDLTADDPLVQRVVQELNLAASLGITQDVYCYLANEVTAIPGLEASLPLVPVTLAPSTTIPPGRPIPASGTLQKAVALAAGNDRTCALLADGGIRCRGMNPDPNIDIAGDFTAVAAGNGYTCMLARNGGVQCVGKNNFGQLGDGTTVDRMVPVDVLGLTEGVSALAAAGNHTCALLVSGGVKCWGRNYFGQLGDGTTAYSLIPVEVDGLGSGVIALAAGSDHTCAVMQTGGVKCWGANEAGQLGDGSLMNRLLPVEVAGLPDPITAVAAGFAHTCALTSQGQVLCWGDNSYGQLGNENVPIQAEPVFVSELTGNPTEIVTGDGTTCVLNQTGGVKCWGKIGWHFDNYMGVVPVKRSTPADITGLTDGIVDLTAGNDHTCALSQNGEVRCWGFLRFGETLASAESVYSPDPIEAIEFRAQPVATPSPISIHLPEPLADTPVPLATAVQPESSISTLDLVWDFILLIVVCILVLLWQRLKMAGRK